MADQLQLRGGSTAQTAAFTGALREVTVDTDKKTVVVHDGTTAGGNPLLRQDLSNLPAGTIDNADINASAGIVDTKLATIATAGKVSNSATTATSANTNSAIVARDASGNFTAGTVTANLIDASGITTSGLNGGPLAGTRNRIINGDMRIDQRNAGAAVTPANNTYTLDRWKNYQTTASKYSVQQNAGSVTPPSGFTNYLGITSLSAYSVLSSDYYTLQQPIEGFNIADLAWGTASAKAIIVSFWVRSSLTGTFGGSLFNAAGARSYPFSYTITAANTWELKTITILGDTSGTWTADNTAGIQVCFGLGAGSTYTATAGAWAAGLFTQPTSSTSIVGTNGATFYITGVQLEAGPVATPFERRSYGQELALCQRYYETGTVSAFAGVINTHHLGAPCSYKATKRAVPTVALVNVANVQFPSTVGAVQSTTTTGFHEVRVANNGGANGHFQSAFTASAEL
jgi:hypothetical protein